MHKRAGFRKGRSTIVHIFTLQSAIVKQFANNSKLYVAFIDFKKAYDTVNRNILWSVLLHSGIQGKMLRNLKTKYRSVQACAMSKSEVSGYFECCQGVLQAQFFFLFFFSLC